ncbi:MAG TPA: cytochrome c [Polyangia bacterium]|nr:cytochrome c [Polyangia bacterium]
MKRLGLVVALVLVGCTGKYIRPTRPDPLPASAELVARGNYLVNSVAACGACHTPRVGANWLGGERTDAFLAGGSTMNDPDEGFFVVVPNISQDKETGIGAWTDDEILRAIRDGVSHDGRLMTPPMPFIAWQVMSDDDARAIVAYLRTTPAIKNTVSRENVKLPFLYKVAASLGAIHHKPAENVKAPDRADKKAYGAYLAKLGICWECHSLGKTGPSDDEDRLMAGSRMAMSEPEYGKLYARNLTPDKETGLGKYTAEQIKQSLKTGRRLDGKMMAPPMSVVIPHLSTWTEEDLDALVTYLVTLKPIKYQVPERQLTPAAKKLVGE